MALKTISENNEKVRLHFNFLYMKDTTNSITRNINYAADHKNFIHKFGQKGITNQSKYYRLSYNIAINLTIAYVVRKSNLWGTIIEVALLAKYCLCFSFKSFKTLNN